MASGLDSLETKIGEADVLTAEAESTLSGLKDKDRSQIAKLVIWLYAAVVLACFAFVLGGLWFLDACLITPANAQEAPAAGAAVAQASSCFAWKEPADYLLQVLTTAVLPIVTLVLGYYFGTAKVEGDNA